MLRVITLLVIALLVAVDQVIKLLVIKHLEPIGSLTLIDGFIQLNYAENTGAAFGSFKGRLTLLSMFTFVIIVIGLGYLLIKKHKVDVEYVCITLIISGGLGNLIDRVFRGYVVDYIEPLFIDFAIFNFADILVTCSCIAYAIWLIYEIHRERKSEKGNNNE